MKINNKVFLIQNNSVRQSIKRQMIYDLQLNFENGIFHAIDFDEDERIKNELEKITSFEKRLIYYNKNVQSLAVQSKDVQIYFEWHSDKPAIKIYCARPNCRNEKDFPEREKIFLRLRAKEVRLIANAINKIATYKEKLQFIFDIKGFYPDRIPVIYPNLPYDEPMYLAKPIIDLRPKNRDETIIYNEFVKAEFDKIAYDENGFSKQYKYFDFEKEKELLNNSLKIDPDTVLQHVKKEIETNFNYPKCFELERKGNKTVAS